MVNLSCFGDTTVFPKHDKYQEAESKQRIKPASSSAFTSGLWAVQMWFIFTDTEETSSSRWNPSGVYHGWGLWITRTRRSSWQNYVPTKSTERNPVCWNHLVLLMYSVVTADRCHSSAPGGSVAEENFLHGLIGGFHFWTFPVVVS